MCTFQFRIIRNPGLRSFAIIIILQRRSRNKKDDFKQVQVKIFKVLKSWRARKWKKKLKKENHVKLFGATTKATDVVLVFILGFTKR